MVELSTIEPGSRDKSVGVTEGCCSVRNIVYHMSTFLPVVNHCSGSMYPFYSLSTFLEGREHKYTESSTLEASSRFQSIWNDSVRPLTSTFMIVG